MQTMASLSEDGDAKGILGFARSDLARRSDSCHANTPAFAEEQWPQRTETPPDKGIMVFTSLLEKALKIGLPEPDNDGGREQPLEASEWPRWWPGLDNQIQPRRFDSVDKRPNSLFRKGKLIADEQMWRRLGHAHV